MEWADFVHLVRTSEQDSAENSSAYRRSVAALPPWLRLGGGLRRRRTGVGGLGVAAAAARAFSFWLVLLLLAAGSLLVGQPAGVVGAHCAA